jgi:hypothetical protein
MVPGAGLEPARTPPGPRDFKSYYILAQHHQLNSTSLFSKGLGAGVCSSLSMLLMVWAQLRAQSDFERQGRCMSKKEPNRDTTGIAEPYEPTPQERAAREALRSRRKRTPRVLLTESKLAGKSMVGWSLEHPNQSAAQYLLMESLGTVEPNFYGPLITQLLKAATNGTEVSEASVNFMVSVIKSIKPKDELEAMLAAQMGAVHMFEHGVRTPAEWRGKHCPTGLR